MMAVPRVIQRAQERSKIADRLADVSVELIDADDGPSRKRLADELRAIADRLESEG